MTQEDGIGGAASATDSETKEAVVVNNNKSDSEGKKMKVETFKKILLAVHCLTLILGAFLFIGGLITNLKHLAYHEAWHTSYGIHNGSVLCIIAGIVGLTVAILGK